MRDMAGQIQVFTEYHDVETWDTSPLRKVTRSHAPLLAILDQAVSSSIGGGGSSMARAKTPLNIGAMSVRDAISDLIRRETIELDPYVDPYPQKSTLRERMLTWWRLFQDYSATDEEVFVWEMIMADWAAQIIALVDPPTKVEIMLPCPVCDATHALIDEGSMVRSLVAWWHRTDADGSMRLECRACREVLGDGIGAVSKKMNEITNPDKKML